MNSITVIYDQSHYLYRWLKPLFASRKEFKELGYKIRYSSIWDYLPIFDGKRREKMEKKAINRACNGKHDIIFMAFHHSTSYLGQLDSEERIEIIKNVKKHCNKLVWLDTADSTGTCLFDVLPYVDLYFKKQLLKDTLDYTRDVYGSRTFCEYYHDLLKIEDETITSRHYPCADKKELHKLRVAWNVGIGDLYAKPHQLLLHPYSVTKPEFIDTDSEKTLDVQYRGSGYSPLAGYPRLKSREMLLEMTDITYPDVTKKIPKDEYIREGHTAKSILSPFGWGEICGRDFEAVVYGGAMIKQSMEHCDTYPNIYQPWTTYIPLKWDFSDFKEILAKSASVEYKQIAKNAQEFYIKCFTREGRKDFANHIINELTR